jgi:hypothetical protein
VPARRRTTFDRWRKRISAQAAQAATTAESGPPVANTIGGRATVASTDPSDTYFVTHTVPAKTASAGMIAAGARTAKTPHAVATPLPPRKRSQKG